MELFLVLIHNLLHSLNRIGIKPFPHVVADAKLLRERPVCIGPRKKYGTVLGIALAGSAILWFAFCVGLIFLDPNPGGVGGRRTGLQVAFCILCLAGPVLIGWCAARYLAARSGRFVLNGDGVLFSCGDDTVFCPWELFNAPGAAVSVGPEKVIVPIAPQAIHLIVVEKAGMLSHSEQIKTRQFVVKASNEVVLLGPYECELIELGHFLLHLGHELSQDTRITQFSRPQGLETAEHIDSQFAWKEQRDWICVRLSRVVFPPYCCGCGLPTDGLLEIRAYPRFLLHLQDGRDHPFIRLVVPACSPCQRAGRSRRLKYCVLWISSALLVFLGLGFVTLALAVAGAVPGVLTGLTLATIIVPAVIAMYGISRSRRRCMPVEASAYSPGNGTVRLRFRRGQYADDLLAACNG